ncbi:MAG: acyl--CoA ligase [Clostridia bacterium]|nr:acyl--CoA ligase [Clostridia bacterium]
MEHTNSAIGRPYPETTMYGAILAAAKLKPKSVAYDFQGKETNYTQFIEKINEAAAAFISAGIRKNDVVTICMPNTPQAVVCLYALNRIGAIASMIHPLSSQKNITYYLNYSDSKMILTLDLFYEKVLAAVNEADKPVKIITARIQEEIGLVKKIAYIALKGKDYTKFPTRAGDLVWSKFVKTGDKSKLPPIEYEKDKTAVILYSGGTSGTPKGIRLSDFSFNALGFQVADITGCTLDDKVSFLSVMPIFHGFGLGIGIHAVLENSAKCILIPQFTKESYAKDVVKKKPNFIAGVPTLYEGLLEVDVFKNADLSFLYGVFAGGDSLSPELKKRFDKFLKEHNANIQIREGYGLTECVTASCVTPIDWAKEGSIGIPLRDMVYRIVEPGTFNEKPLGEEGEIILTGPTLMLGYLGHEEENASTLRKDENGTTWLFTADIGSMDADGFVYFKQRMKRMIISSGYNVYPSQVEKVLDKHPDIAYSCAIGVHDPYKMQKVRAYIVLNENAEESEEEKTKIIKYCKEYLDFYSVPKEIIFKKELPRTLVGKVAYHQLEEEAALEEQ